MAKTSPALQTAVEELRRMAAGAACRRIPPIRELAGTLGVSHATAHKALRKLTDEGVLRQEATSGRFVISRARAGEQVQGSAALDTVTATLKRWIFSGRYDHDGRLPPITSIARMLGRSRNTVRSAVSRLAKQGLVLQSGRQINVAAGLSGGHGARIALVGHPNMFHIYHRAHVMLAGIEREIAHCGWPPVAYCLQEDFRSQRTRKLDRIAGYLFIIGHQPWLESYLATRIDRNVVVLDPVEASAPWNPVNGWRIVCDNREAGREVGRFLAARGHRFVVWANHLGAHYSWARSRLAGIRDVFPGTVEEWCIQEAPPTTVAYRSRSLERRSYGLFVGRTAIPRPTIDEHLQGISKLKRLALLVDSLRQTFVSRLSRRVTAVVGVNDDIVVALRAAIGDKPTHLPALIGFDNTPSATRLGISSYEFPFDLMGRLAVRTFENPAQLQYDTKKMLRVAGHLVERNPLPLSH